MRKNVIGIVVGLPLVWSLAACSDDGDPGNAAGGAGGSSTTDATSAGGAAGASSGAAGASSGAAGTSSGAAGETVDAGKDTGPVVDGAPADAVPGALAVYTMSNAAAANQVFGFNRAADGTLTPMASPFATGGKGSGMGLGEQGAIAFDRPNNRLYAVNAGDNSFSVFPVNADGTLGTATHVETTAIDAGGVPLVGPKSITFHENAVHALFQGNATTPSMIAGWTVGSAGGTPSATPIAGSALPLSSTTQSVDPAQIEFSPDGQWLVVTEKQSGAAGAVMGAGSIDTFGVAAGGVASKKGFYPTASAGADAGLQMTPFGFEFAGDYLIVSEAGSTGVGSYTYANGAIAPAVGASQFLPTDPAPCWVAVASNWAYVANARGPSIGGFTVNKANGGLSNIGPVANGTVASTGRMLPSDAGLVFQGPTDEFVTYDGQFLYALNAAVPSIGIFRINNDGTLSRVGSGDYTTSTAALAAGSAGIVAR